MVIDAVIVLCAGVLTGESTLWVCYFNFTDISLDRHNERLRTPGPVGS